MGQWLFLVLLILQVLPLQTGSVLDQVPSALQSLLSVPLSSNPLSHL